MIRLARSAISLLGVFGLSLALVYLFAVAISFMPQGAAVAEIMVGRHEGERGWALILVAVPYLLLITHLMLRTRFGHWLVERNAHDEAIDYCSDRLEFGFTRGKTEVESHRTALMRAYLATGRTDEARGLLRSYPTPHGYGSIRLEGIFWRLQTALRVDDLVTANKLASEKVRGRTKLAGRTCALDAVIAAREGDRERWEASLEAARWKRSPEYLVAWARAVGVVRFELVAEAQESLQSLEGAADALDSEVEGRAVERLILLADLAELCGEDGHVDRLERAFERDDADPRSSRLVADRSAR